MYARLTLLEVDLLRTDLDTALALFTDEVLPKIRDMEGYRGVYVLTTPDGKGALVSFWDTAEQAETDAEGWYAQTLGEYATMFRSPPGRERYDVRLADVPALASG